MAHKLITSLRQADRILTSVNCTGNFNIFAQVQRKRLELRQFLSQLSSHPPSGFDKPFSQRNGNKSRAYTARGIAAERKFSSLSGGANGREGDKKKSKVAPGSGGKEATGILGIGRIYLNHRGSVRDDFFGRRTIVAQLVNAAKSTDSQIQSDAVYLVRKLLTSIRNPPIDFLIGCNILPTLVDCLSSQKSGLQFEALFALTKIVNGTSQQIQAVVEAGVVPHFVRLLTSPHDVIRELALVSLGLIIVDGPQLRDCVIKLGVVDSLLNCIQPDTPINFQRRVAFVICILCLNRGMPPPPETFREILPTLNVLVHHEDPNVLLITVRTLKLLTGGGKKQIQMVIDSGALLKLVQLLNSGEVEVQELAVRAVGNIVTYGTLNQVQAVLNCDVLSHFHSLLNQPKKDICEMALVALSNVAKRSSAQVQSVIEAGLVSHIVRHLEKGDFQTQKTAALALSTTTMSGTKEQVEHLIDCGVIPLFINLLNCKDSEVVHKVLVGIDNILEKLSGYQGSGDKAFTLIEECGGWGKIQTLQQHENMNISKIAHHIILKFSLDHVEE